MPLLGLPELLLILGVQILTSRTPEAHYSRFTRGKEAESEKGTGLRSQLPRSGTTADGSVSLP